MHDALRDSASHKARSRTLPTLPLPSPPKPLNVPRRPAVVSMSGPSHQTGVTPLSCRQTESPAGPRMRPLPYLPPPKSALTSGDNSFRPRALPRVPRATTGPTASFASGSSTSLLVAPNPLPPPLRTRFTPELRSNLDDDSDLPYTPPDEIHASTSASAPPPKSILSSTAPHPHNLPPSLAPPRPPSMPAPRKRNSARRRAMAAVRVAAGVAEGEDDEGIRGKPQPAPRRKRDSRAMTMAAVRASADAWADDDSYAALGERTRLTPSVRYSRKWIREKGASREIVREGEESYKDILRALRAL